MKPSILDLRVDRADVIRSGHDLATARQTLVMTRRESRMIKAMRKFQNRVRRLPFRTWALQKCRRHNLTPKVEERVWNTLFFIMIVRELNLMAASGVNSEVPSAATQDGWESVKPSPRSPLQSFVLAGIGLGGAFVAWKLMGAIGRVFALPPDLAGLAFGAAPPPEVASRLVRATFLMNLKNAAVWMSVSGAVFGTLFGIGLFALRRPQVRFLRIVPATLLCGAAFGALAGCVTVYVDSIVRMKMDPGATSPPEHFVLLTHSLTWLTVGLGIGLGLSLGVAKAFGKCVEFASMVALAGMLGGCLYPIVAGILFPEVNSASPIPFPDPLVGRLLWLGLPASLMGLASGRGRKRCSISQP